MKQLAGLSVLIIILFAIGCGQENGQKPKENFRQKQVQTTAILEREIEQQRKRAQGLEQDVKELQDDLSVTHAIAYICVVVALLFLVLLIREKYTRKSLEKVI